MSSRMLCHIKLLPISLLGLGLIILATAPHGSWAQKSTGAEAQVLAKPADTTARSLKQQLAYEHLQFTQRELFQVKSELRKLTIEVRVLEARDKKFKEAVIPDDVINETIDKDSSIAQSNQLLSERKQRQQVAIATSNLGEKDPYVQRLQKQIEAQKEKMSARRLHLRGAVTEQLRKNARAEGLAILAQRQDQMEILKELEKELELEVKQMSENPDVIIGAEASGRNPLGRLEVEVRQLRAAIEELKELAKKGK